MTPDFSDQSAATPNDAVAACAEIVQQGDRDKFLATMAAPPQFRAALFAIFAFNVEVSRAPWQSREPMIAQIRLQWWADEIAALHSGRGAGAGGGDVETSHHIFAALTGVLDPKGAEILGELVAARRADISPEGFADHRALERYIDATSGGLIWVAARALGAKSGEAAIRDMGYAMGLANWFRAVPNLVAHGHEPLQGLDDDAIKALAVAGIARLKRSRGGVMKPAHYATRAGWQANRTLHSVAANPAAVSGGRLHNSEFRRRGSLIIRVLSGAP